MMPGGSSEQQLPDSHTIFSGRLEETHFKIFMFMRKTLLLSYTQASPVAICTLLKVIQTKSELSTYSRPLRPSLLPSAVSARILHPQRKGPQELLGPISPNSRWRKRALAFVIIPCHEMQQISPFLSKTSPPYAITAAPKQLCLGHLKNIIGSLRPGKNLPRRPGGILANAPLPFSCVGGRRMGAAPGFP